MKQQPLVRSSADDRQNPGSGTLPGKAWPAALGHHPLLWIGLAALPFLMLNLGTPAMNDGESMYAEIAREMRLSGDWITPRLNGTPHFDKPPLIYWLIALGQKLFGETESCARFWPALATWGTILIVGAIGHALYGRRAGALSALVFATCLGPYIFGRMVMPDPMLVFLIALSILGYVKGYLADSDEPGVLWAGVLFGTAGVALLTKGVLGPGLPAVIIGLHALLTGRWRRFLSWSSLAGLGLAALIAFPWHAAVARANPGFLFYYFIREHFLRFAGTRYPPDEFVSMPLFLGLTFLWTFPWMALLPQAVFRSLRGMRLHLKTGAPELLPLLWMVVVVGLFAASKSRLEYYGLPALPACALLIGKLWDDAMRGGMDRPNPRAFHAALWTMALLMGLAAAAALAVLGPAKDLVFSAFAHWWPTGGWMKGTEEALLLERIRIPTMATFAEAALFTAGALAALYRSRIGTAFGLLAATMVPLFILVHWGFTVVEPWQSSRQTAEIVLHAAGPSDVIVLQEPHEYMWVGGINYYTKRPVTILKDPQFEGVVTRRREPPERFVDEKTLEALWRSDKHIVLVTDVDSSLPETVSRFGPVEAIGRTPTHVVLGNRPAERAEAGNKEVEKR